VEGDRGVRVRIAGCEKDERRIARGMIHRKIWGARWASGKMGGFRRGGSQKGGHHEGGRVRERG
jgi:hypothetical protein